MSTLLNARDLALQAATYRSTDTLVTISASAGAFKTPKNGALTTPTNIVLTATPNNVFTVAAVYTWHYALSTAPATWVPLSTGTTATVTNTNILAIIGEATWVQYRCAVTENLLTTATDFFTLSYSKEVSEPIIVDISRTNAIIPCSAAGVPTGYTNTDTSISVSRGGIALTYSAAGGANTFKVAIQADDVARTVGTSSNTSTVYSLSGITNITVDIATVIFIVTVYDASGTIVSPTIGKQITYTKVTNGVVGGDATFYYIDTSAPVISKSVSSALISGTHTNITAIGKKVVGSSLPVLAGYLTITANGDTEAALAVNSITTAINNTAGKTSYTIKMYNQATVAGATLLDTEVIPVLFTGSDNVTAVLTNDAASIPTNSAGTAGIYTATPTELHVYEGTTELVYDTVGTSAGTWKILSTSATSITIGTITDSGTFATIGTASNIIADTASITYNISGTSRGGNAFTATKVQTFSKAYAGAQGVQGVPGSKSITISAFKWDTVIGTFAQAATYTWGGTINVYPAGWAASAPASTANGQTLFQLNLTIVDTSTVPTTAVNWSNAVSNTIGYRVDGSVGPQGNSHRTAYIVNTSATAPASPTPLAGDQPPTGWSYTATSTLTAGQFMYQVDGILTTGGNIAWGNPYLSNLKVGSLSAISANMGVVNISSTGSLASTGKGYGTGSGFYMGYSSTAYKFDIGNTTDYLRWDGTNIIATGLVIKNSAGATILSSGSAVAADIMNSANTASSVGALSKSGTDILSGVISLDATVASGFKTGTLVWNSAGAWVSGSGVALTPGGLVGYKSDGTNTFSISNSTGTAIFRGDISGATYTTTSGKFSVSSAGVLTAIGGYFSGTLAAGTVDFASSVGYSTTYNTVGTYSIIVPTGMTRCSAKLYGGGGGGGGGAWYNFGLSGGGGGSGGLASLTFTVTPGSTLTLYVGAGGTAGAPGARGTTGTAGGATTLSGILSSTGGGGGGGATEGGGWGGAAGTNGSIGGSSTSNSVGGYGATSPIGIGGNPGYGNTNTSATTGGFAAGGGGGGSNDNSQLAGEYAAAGGGGIAILDFFDPGGVVLKAPFETLKSELRSQGHTLS